MRASLVNAVAWVMLSGCAAGASGSCWAPPVDWSGDRMDLTAARTNATVQVMLIDEQVPSVMAASMLGHERWAQQAPSRAVGLSNPQSGTPDQPCLVVVYRPAGLDDVGAFYAMGHEMWHCLAGPYHGPKS